MSKRTIKRKIKSPKKKATAASKGTERMDVSHEKLKSIFEETRKFLSEDDAELLEDAIDTLAVVTNELEMKGASIRRLRKLLFGSSTEKLSNVFPDSTDRNNPADASENGDETPDTSNRGDKPAISLPIKTKRSARATAATRPKTIPVPTTSKSITNP